MLVTIVVAMDRNRLIGDGDRLPWRLPADLRRFKSLTMGKSIVMGRRTHESIGRALPGRRNIVLSRNRDFRAEGCEVLADLGTALERAEDADEVMIVGGAQIYAQALPLTGRMHLTLVDAVFSGDTWFPDYDEREWREVYREDHAAGEESGFAFSFVDVERV